MANTSTSFDSFHELSTCTKENCILNGKEEKNGVLVCRKCTRKVHYVCSQLPAYQIQLCLTSKSRSFQCQNCVKVPEELKKKCLREEQEKIERLEKEVAACENIIKVQTETTSRLVQQCKETKNMEKKIESITTCLQVSMNKKISELEETMKKGLSKIEIMEKKYNEKPNKTYSEATKNEFTEKFRKVLKEENSKMKKEEKIKEKTKFNLIIKNIYDPANDGKTKEEIYQQDRRSVNEILKDLKRPDIEPSHITRIGKPPTPSNRRPRPIRIVLKSIKEKMDILDNVKFLKNKNTHMSITEDLTWEERMIMKEWYGKANERNEKEDNDDVKWCVRGSPRTRLYLKRIV